MAFAQKPHQKTIFLFFRLSRINQAVNFGLSRLIPGFPYGTDDHHIYISLYLYTDDYKNMYGAFADIIVIVISL